MKFVIQRVSSASCTVIDEHGVSQIRGSIGQGFLVLVGIAHDDNQIIADKMIKKLIGLRIFEDAEGRTNLSLSDVNGSLLLVSQFTLYADCKKGNRPSFIRAGNPELANELYQYIVEKCSAQVTIVRQGVFGANMKLSLLNDGPFTIVLDSAEIF